MKKPLLLAATIGTLLIGLAACAPVKILNTITPSGSFDREKNISYGPIERQKLDIYRAEKPRLNAPVLMFVHGGSWDSGSKNIYKFLGQGFTAEGFDVVIPNYRLYPDAVFPVMIEDTAKAIAFTAQQFPGRELVVMGHSAGAYNALMTVMRPEFYPGGASAMCSTIAGVVALAPPTGIVPLKEEPLITVFPDRFTAADAPMNNVTGAVPPVFFGHGMKDTTVFPQNSQMLAEKITARGGQARVETYADLDHIDVIKVMSRYFDGGSSLKADVIDFIDGLDTNKRNYCQ